MNAIIVSDLHMGSNFFQFPVFERFLDALPEGHELILNGDVVDRPYAIMEASHQRILDMVERLSFRRKVVWVQGNHDNGCAPKSFGKIEFRRQHTIGSRLLITHGDDFDDIMPRSRLFIRAFRLMHHLRVKLGAKPVHVAEYAKKWKSLYRVLLKNVASNAVAYAGHNGFEAVTCGHTHYPEDRLINGVRYINTGAWTEYPAFFLLISANEMSLCKIDDSSMVSQFKAAGLSEAHTDLRLKNFSLNPSAACQDIGKIRLPSAAPKLDPQQPLN